MTITLEAPTEVAEERLSLPEPWRWTRDDYHRALELGFFSEEDKIELIDGEIYSVSPQSRKHFRTILRSARLLEQIFGPGYSVEQQGPTAMSPRSEPEPDITVIRGDSDDYDDHPDPSSIVLVAEVSDSSLAKDRLIKGESYARAGIQDYWLQNLQNRTVEVRRDPGPDPDDPSRIIYRSIHVFTEDEAVSPLELPDSPVLVADLFRRKQ